MKRESGFLLIEVLIAIAVISIAVVSAMGGLTGALKITARSESYLRDVLPLEELMFQLETGAREDLVQNGGTVEAEDHLFEIEETPIVLNGDGETDAMTLAVQPLHRLKIRTTSEDRGQLWSTELILGQELLKS